MATHPLLFYQTTRGPVYIVLGRLIAAGLLAVILSLSVTSDRDKAKRELALLTEKSYAAGYARHRTELKEVATQSDGRLVGVGGMLLFFILAYEGSAVLLGWGIGYVKTVVAADRPPP